MGLFSRKKKTALNTAPIVTHIKFGNWQGEPIQWRILSNGDGRMFMLSQYVIDGMPFNKEKFQGNDYEVSDIRWWLNSPFKKNAFTPEEQERILGEISLLSLEEKKKYGVEGICVATEYAKTVKNVCNPYVNMLGEGLENVAMWWLRDKGHFPDDVKIVGYDGTIMDIGVIMPDGGVRPAMWIQKTD